MVCREKKFGLVKFQIYSEKNSGGNMEAKVGDVIMLYDNDMTKKSKGLFPCKIMNRPKYFMVRFQLVNLLMSMIIPFHSLIYC